MSYNLKEDLEEINNQIKKARLTKRRGEMLRLRKAKANKQREIDEMARVKGILQ